MADEGHEYTDKKIKKIEGKINTIYSQAQRELEATYSDFQSRFAVKDARWQALLSTAWASDNWTYDQCTELQNRYENWKLGQVFQGKQWQNKIDSMSQTLHYANQAAASVVNDNLIETFAWNANYQTYHLEKDMRAAYSFDLYDRATVTNLIKNNPTLLPTREIDPLVDIPWNQKKITSEVTQSILQGEPIAKVAERLQRVTGANRNSALTNARTAMTGAQNAGREQSLKDAKALGINVMKEWMATLDFHTRMSHRDMDGVKIPIGDKWHHYTFPNGCKFPGDPSGPPWEVYNCRCTMVGDLVDYPSEYQRYDNIDGKPIQNISYNDWYKAKQAEIAKAKLVEQNAGKIEEIQNKIGPLQKQIDEFETNSYEGIWKDPVTEADYAAKKGAIDAKRAYFENKLATDPDNAEKWQEMLDKLDEFEKNGKAYYDLQQQMSSLKSELGKLSTPTGSTSFGGDAYSQDRKDAAVWAKSARDADGHLRDGCGEVWRGASEAERDAAYLYTTSYSPFNEPLRGWEYGSTNYATGSGFVGVGNTDLNAGRRGNGDNLNNLTNMISRSAYDEDFWLQRGCNWGGMDSFLGVDAQLLRSGTQAELEAALLGTTPTEYGFMSCGDAKGMGFSSNPIIFNVYAPRGTQMLYAEPYSAFGNGDGRGWNGISNQRSFGHEAEVILQQGTQFRVSKVERSNGGTIYIDLEVINQGDVQIWKG